MFGFHSAVFCRLGTHLHGPAHPLHILFMIALCCIEYVIGQLASLYTPFLAQEQRNDSIRQSGSRMIQMCGQLPRKWIQVADLRSQPSLSTRLPVEPKDSALTNTRYP